jgi:hypothetical protein
MNTHLKHEGQECKAGPVQEWILMGKRRMNREGEGGQI